MLHAGQEIQLRIAAFPYQRHGHLPATITRVSESLVLQQDVPHGLLLKEPSYWAWATVAAEGWALKLRPGMVLQAELIRERGQVYDWVLKPLRRWQGR